MSEYLLAIELTASSQYRENNWPKQKKEKNTTKEKN